MGEETILESIFFDREQRVLANVSDEEKNVILEIKRDGNEEKYYKQGFKDGVNLIVECVS